MKKYIIAAVTITLTFMLLIPAACGGKAEFQAGTLSISPAVTVSGEPAKVTLDVENIGDGEGTYSVVLTVDGVIEDTKEIILSPGIKETVVFNLSRDDAGSYLVDMNGLIGTLEVLEPAGIIDRAYKNMEDLQCFRADMAMDIKMESEEFNGQGEISMLMDIEMAADFEENRIKMVLSMQADVPDEPSQDISMETYLIENAVYARVKAPGEDEKWQFAEAMPDMWQQMLDVQDQMTIPSDVLKGAEVTLAGTETVDGVDCYIFDVVIAEGAYQAAMESQTAGPLGNITAPGLSGFDTSFLEAMDITMRQWIAIDECYVKKMEMALEMDLKPLVYMKISTDVNFADPTKPVVIELPPEAAGLSEGQEIPAPSVKSEGAETSNRFPELLGLIPADLKDSPITVIDYESYRQTKNVSFSDPDEYINWAIYDDEVMGVASQQIGAGSFITGGGEYALKNTIRDEYVGYNLTDVDAEIQAGYPPNEFVAAIGRFSPQATADALSRQDEWSTEIIDSYTTEDYQGITIHSWGDGLKTHLSARMTPPHVDSLGRARPLAVTERYLFYAAQTAGHVQVMIDASQDRWRSLADLPELVQVADGLAELGAYVAVMGYAGILGYEDWFQIMLGEGSKLTESEIEALEEEFKEKDQPRLKKYIAFGSGLGEDVKGKYMALVLVHESAADAEANDSLLDERIENTGSMFTSRPWNQIILHSEIRAEGKLLLAKMYIYYENFWLSWFFQKDSLLLYETEDT